MKSSAKNELIAEKDEKSPKKGRNRSPRAEGLGRKIWGRKIGSENFSTPNLSTKTFFRPSFVSFG
jgi:hypothetical protein